MARLNRVKSFRGTSKTKDGKLTCGRCGDKIDKGDPYLWWATRTPGSRSGIRHIRCTKSECYPRPSEYRTSSPHIAAVMDAEFFGHQSIDALKYETDGAEAYVSAAEDAVHEAAEGVRTASEGYEESANAIEEGFGHETEQSTTLKEKAEALSEQADDLENWSWEGNEEPEGPESEDYVESWCEEVQEGAREAITEKCELP